jgi:SAM-dependent methyltransferase
MCRFSQEGYPTASGQPVLVDFERSVFRRGDYDDHAPVVPQRGARFSGSFRTYTNNTFRDKIRQVIYGVNHVAKRNSFDVLASLKQNAERPRLLIIGGGTLGLGTDTLYNDGSVDIAAVDVYPSPYTCLLADAHGLPFADAVFDGVWIQAVLEHVLEPHVVVQQIHRVLKPQGVVYAETPFMMQVHEGAYDFTRFTRSGHRWLFRDFEQIDSGLLGGAGWSMLWAVRYFWRGFGFGEKVATALTAPFFWLRYFDHLMRHRPNADAGLGFFFFGRKSSHALSHQDIIAYYQTQ